MIVFNQTTKLINITMPKVSFMKTNTQSNCQKTCMKEQSIDF